MLTMLFPKMGVLTQMPCSQKYLTAAVAGAIVAATGSDTAFAQYSPMLTPEAHYALAGIAVDVTCREAMLMPTNWENIKELGRTSFFGFGGACVYKTFIW